MPSLYNSEKNKTNLEFNCILAEPVPVPLASSSSTTPRRSRDQGPASVATTGSSPSKTPVNVTDVTPEHHPGSIRRSSSVASDKDKTFEGKKITQ